MLGVSVEKQSLIRAEGPHLGVKVSPLNGKKWSAADRPLFSRSNDPFRETKMGQGTARSGAKPSVGEQVNFGQKPRIVALMP